MSSGTCLSPRLDLGADALQHNSHPMHCFSGDNRLVLTCAASDGMFWVFFYLSLSINTAISQILASLCQFLFTGMKENVHFM